MKEALSGAILLGFWAIGLFFHQFYRKKRDRLFAFFACSFWLLTFERALLLALGWQKESTTYVYIVRLIAFLFILYAIYDKNRSSPPQPVREKIPTP